MASTPQKPRKRPRFWVGPFVVGFCFAFGYGITQRLLIHPVFVSRVNDSTFSPGLFPGETLKTMHLRYGEGKALLDIDSVALQLTQDLLGESEVNIYRAKNVSSFVEPSKLSMRQRVADAGPAALPLIKVYEGLLLKPRFMPFQFEKPPSLTDYPQNPR